MIKKSTRYTRLVGLIILLYMILSSCSREENSSSFEIITQELDINEVCNKIKNGVIYDCWDSQWSFDNDMQNHCFLIKEKWNKYNCGDRI